jgi:hypothetical protein
VAIEARSLTKPASSPTRIADCVLLALRAGFANNLILAPTMRFAATHAASQNNNTDQNI